MRLNIYHHETPTMVERHELVTKEAEGRTFYGIRFYTEPPLMDMPGDDDSSALTLWAMPNGDTTFLRRIAEAIHEHAAEIENR